MSIEFLIKLERYIQENCPEKIKLFKEICPLSDEAQQFKKGDKDAGV